MQVITSPIYRTFAPPKQKPVWRLSEKKKRKRKQQKADKKQNKIKQKKLNLDGFIVSNKIRKRNRTV